MITQLWQAEAVPRKIPQFVDPHITSDFNYGSIPKRFYIFEVDPAHHTFSNVVDMITVAKNLLVKSGFKNPRFITTENKPDDLVKCSCPYCTVPYLHFSQIKRPKSRGFNS